MSQPGRAWTLASPRAGRALLLLACLSVSAAAAGPVPREPIDAPGAKPTPAAASTVGEPDPSDGERDPAPVTGENDASDAVTPDLVDAPPFGDGNDPVVAKTRAADAGDALFVAAGTALGGGAGFAAVALTSTTVIYSTIRIAELAGPYAWSQYWGWSLLGIAPVVISLAAIPIGGAFGMWWGAGLRGLPFPLVDALAHMFVGLLFGAAAGGMAMAPVGVALGAMAMAGLGPLGRPPNPLQYQAPWLASVGAWVVVPLFLGVLPATTLGMAVGGTVGPVLTAGRWGLYAKSAYGTIETPRPGRLDAE